MYGNHMKHVELRTENIEHMVLRKEIKRGVMQEIAWNTQRTERGK
jgi:hypothetical protein